MNTNAASTMPAAIAPISNHMQRHLTHENGKFCAYAPGGRLYGSQAATAIAKHANANATKTATTGAICVNPQER